MLTINDLKIGTKFLFKNQPYQVISCQHSKLGRGGGILRTKIKNLLDGSIIEHTFAGAEKFEPAEMTARKAQYLYQADNQYFFMNSEDFEQFGLDEKQIGNLSKFLKGGEKIDIIYFDGRPISIQLPIKIKFKVAYTEPGFKGNTASTVLKPATLETGSQINVPLFIKEGDEIIVDTRTGQYVERA